MDSGKVRTHTVEVDSSKTSSDAITTSSSITSTKIIQTHGECTLAGRGIGRCRKSSSHAGSDYEPHTWTPLFENMSKGKDGAEGNVNEVGGEEVWPFLQMKSKQSNPREWSDGETKTEDPPMHSRAVEVEAPRKKRKYNRRKKIESDDEAISAKSKANENENENENEQAGNTFPLDASDTQQDPFSDNPVSSLVPTITKKKKKIRFSSSLSAREPSTVSVAKSQLGKTSKEPTKEQELGTSRSEEIHVSTYPNTAKAVFSRDLKNAKCPWLAPLPDLTPSQNTLASAEVLAAVQRANNIARTVLGDQRRPKWCRAAWGVVHKGTQTHRAYLHTTARYMEEYGAHQPSLPVAEPTRLQQCLYRLVAPPGPKVGGDGSVYGAAVLDCLHTQDINAAMYAERVVVMEEGPLHGEFGVVATQTIPADRVLGVYGGQYVLQKEYECAVHPLYDFKHNDHYLLPLDTPTHVANRWGQLVVDPYPMRHKDPNTPKFGKYLLMYMNDPRTDPLGKSPPRGLSSEESARCNVELCQIDYYGWPVKVAVTTKEITEGQWLLWDYGVDYWTARREAQDLMFSVVDDFSCMAVDMARMCAQML